MEIVTVSLISTLISTLVSCVVNYILKKKNDKYIAKLDKGNHITKVQFDYEYTMYQDLSLAAFDCVAKTEILFPCGLVISPPPTKEIHLNRYKEAVDKLNLFTSELYKSRSFMDEKLFTLYQKLRNNCDRQVTGYYFVYIDSASNIDDSKYFDRTKEIREDYDSCSCELRNYLKNLCVME